MAKKKYYQRPDGLYEAIRVVNGKRKAFRGRTPHEVERGQNQKDQCPPAEPGGVKPVLHLEASPQAENPRHHHERPANRQMGRLPPGRRPPQNRSPL